MNTLRTSIMRRVYTAYALRILVGQRTRSMAIMFVSLLLLAKFVSVVSVFENLARVEVAQLFSFFLSALRYTESVTLLMLVVFAYAAFSFTRTLIPVRFSHFA